MSVESPFSRLLKVINLERRQGYRNKAVIGGLDKFASRWEADARASTTEQAIVGEIVALLIGYPSVSEQVARERIVEQVSRRVRQITEATGGATIDSVPERPAPAAQPTPAERPGPSGSRPPSSGQTPAPAADRRPPKPAGARPSVSRGESRPPTVDERPSSQQPPEPAGQARLSNGTEREAPAARRNAGPGGSERPAGRDAAPNRSKPVLPPARPDTGGEPARPRRKRAAPERESAPGAGRRQAVTRQRSAPAPAADIEGLGLDAPVTRLPSIGPAFAEKLGKLGVQTVSDLLHLLPHRYDDYTRLRTIDRLRYGDVVTVIATPWKVETRPIAEGRKLVVAVVGDGTGEMEMSWFNPFMERQLHTGRAFVFSGKVDSFRGKLIMRNPECELLDRNQIHTNRLVPVYPLTEGISVRWLRRVIKNTVDAWAPRLDDFLPERIRQEMGLLPQSDALTQIHFPDNLDTLAAAHRRLSFNEFFLLQLGVLRHRRQFRDATAQALRTDDDILAQFVAELPFGLTGAQRRSLAEISSDLATTEPMSRLLQGDVGSGKTAIAAAALWLAVANGGQGAIIAPTEILAEQHARSLGSLFAGLTRPDGRPVQIALFTGHLGKSERDERLESLARGEIDIAIGTHALIQEGVGFQNLSVAVVDEQHRFGVQQRAALRLKGTSPHMLVMSATPIPRSLALTMYGDLDISVIDEMPEGRTPVKTKWLAPTQRERAYGFIRKQVAAGHQAFIIYPLVENSEHSESKAAVDEHVRLQKTIFPNLRVGLLHGRMKSEDKDSVMRAFSQGELDVLVATSVVEVGIDVPNATVILIEGAERFGLAQLHQFRGRVGRAEHPSYCILVSDAMAGTGAQRLAALETNNDGFALAQIDLEMRGPGDFLGTRQSGLPALRTAELTDLRTLEDARAAAQRLFAVDPELIAPEHEALATALSTFWSTVGEIS